MFDMAVYISIAIFGVVALACMLNWIADELEMEKMEEEF